jgi:hypothetical protein
VFDQQLATPAEVGVDDLHVRDSQRRVLGDQNLADRVLLFDLSRHGSFSSIQPYQNPLFGRARP